MEDEVLSTREGGWSVSLEWLSLGLPEEVVASLPRLKFPEMAASPQRHRFLSKCLLRQAAFLDQLA